MLYCHVTFVLVFFLLLSAPGAKAQARWRDFARSLNPFIGLQGRVLWVDATANLDRITTREGVADIVARAKKANITTLVVDVKPISGHVLFTSKIAEPLVEWRGKTYPRFDVLAAFIEEGHRAGIEIAASLNVFSEGHKHHKIGLAYKKTEWQSVTYLVDRGLVAPNGARLPIRAESEPIDPNRTTVYGASYVQDPTPTHGTTLAIALDSDRRVAGMVDTALLGDEPLTAPDDGQMLVVSDKAMEWAARNLRAGDITRYEAIGRRLPIVEAGTEPVAAFVNPLHPEARRYELSLLQEVAQNYNVDAIVFDRMRYSSLYNDFSELSRGAFEKWLGQPINRWPEDVLSHNPIPGEPPRRGPLFKKWLEFRARVIRDFVREATETLRAIKPNLQFGAYVGSWYGEYYGVGVNWGSEKFPVRLSWASPTYHETGYAEFLDWLSTGCYYPIPTREEARVLRQPEGGTVETAAELSLTAVANSVPVYAGLYVLNYVNRPDAFARALNVAVKKSNGVMIFDVSYIYDYGWWPLLEQTFSQPVTPPHRYADLTTQLRTAQDAVRSLLDARGSDTPIPAVPYQPGGG